MTLSIYQATVPVFVHALGALSAVLDKAAAFAEAKKVEPTVMCGLRLTADMLPLSRHVSTTCDFAKWSVARLSGVDAPVFNDDEKDFAELRSRIARTLEFIRSVPQADVEAGAGRTINLKIAGVQRALKPEDYLNFYVLPNFYFHATTTYAILRANGVELGKKDYLGPLFE